MLAKITLLVATLLFFPLVYGPHPGPGPGLDAPPPATGPQYTADAQLRFPEKYREWVFLSSGVDMSYGPGAAMAGHTMFDNVFVNPEAYAAFVQTGKWPDRTELVLEVRGGESKGSINQHGHYQGTNVMGTEVHVRDEARFPGKWAFYAFDDKVKAKMIPESASCYTCHAQHAAVQTTFVQFYPTLLEIARSKATLSPAYLKEIAVEPDPEPRHSLMEQALVP
jgi:hypothetical protein